MATCEQIAYEYDGFALCYAAESESMSVSPLASQYLVGLFVSYRRELLVWRPSSHGDIR